MKVELWGLRTKGCKQELAVWRKRTQQKTLQPKHQLESVKVQLWLMTHGGAPTFDHLQSTTNWQCGPVQFNKVRKKEKCTPFKKKIKDSHQCIYCRCEPAFLLRHLTENNVISGLQSRTSFSFCGEPKPPTTLLVSRPVAPSGGMLSQPSFPDSWKKKFFNCTRASERGHYCSWIPLLDVEDWEAMLIWNSLSFEMFKATTTFFTQNVMSLHWVQPILIVQNKCSQKQSSHKMPKHEI